MMQYSQNQNERVSKLLTTSINDEAPSSNAVKKSGAETIFTTDSDFNELDKGEKSGPGKQS